MNADVDFLKDYAERIPGACWRCGCSREVDDEGERVCFCDSCKDGGCQAPEHGCRQGPSSSATQAARRLARLRRVARQVNIACQPCQPDAE